MIASSECIIHSMGRAGMIPVFYHANVAIAMKIIDAAYEGGARAFEFTNRGPEAHSVFVRLVEHCKQYPDAFIGIGTILDARNTLKFINAGAQFIVSPVFKKEMAEVCLEHEVMWVPGCATLTEMVAATDCGAELIKMFPASVLGPRFVSSIRQVMPDIRLMPTGGVEASGRNLKDWFSAGVTCVGMGSQLISSGILAGHDWSGLRDNVASLIGRIAEIRLSISKS
jgi:2-dehydro-3-deoxyphosphogluconate aldolase / (4S)-4-hydroxy-2-oxoglutarate aldolase